MAVFAVVCGILAVITAIIFFFATIGSLVIQMPIVLYTSLFEPQYDQLYDFTYIGEIANQIRKEKLILLTVLLIALIVGCIYVGYLGKMSVIIFVIFSISTVIMEYCKALPMWLYLFLGLLFMGISIILGWVLNDMIVGPGIMDSSSAFAAGIVPAGFMILMSYTDYILFAFGKAFNGRILPKVCAIISLVIGALLTVGTVWLTKKICGD